MRSKWRWLESVAEIIVAAAAAMIIIIIIACQLQKEQSYTRTQSTVGPSESNNTGVDWP